MKKHITRTSLIASIMILLFCPLKSQEQKTNLPTIYLTTNDGSAITSKEDWKAGRIVVKSSNQSEELSVITEIRGRGNSTWSMAKKPYRIKLDKRTNLLNLPAREKNWVFLANYADKTLLRNALAFKISEMVGLEFTPSVRFVDLVFNGSYLGNYLLTDQIEVKEFRVPVEEQELTATKEPEISGGYLLEIDGFADGEPVWFRTPQGLPITIKYPKDDEINNTQKNYIINYTNDFENRLFSSNFKDETAGYRAKVDSVSLVNWYIACELTGNSDSFWSTYIYKKRSDDKLYFGPLWDFDIAFNNDNRLGDASNKLMREHAHNYRNWIERFWLDEWFRKAVARRWTELLQDNISAQLVDYLSETAELLDESQQLNFNRWNNLNNRVYLETFLFDTYKKGVDFLKSYIINRVNFLTKEFAYEELYPSEPFPNADYMIMNKKARKVIQVKDNSDKRNAELNMWEPLNTNNSQFWRIIPVDEEYVNIINRYSGLAMTGNGYDNSLIQITLNENNDSQKWRIIPVGDGDIYGIENKSTNYSINNSGGGTENGNRVIEYTSSIHLEEKTNQHWQFLKIENSSGITQNPKGFEIVLYPNPAKEFAYVKIQSEISSRFDLSIYTISGNKLYSKNYNTLPAGQQIVLPVHGLESGIYFVELRTDTGLNLTQKLIVK